MDSSQSDNPGGDRRLSTAASERSSSNSNSNSEESYHLEDIAVADGFRPSYTQPGPENSTSQPESRNDPPPPLPLLLPPSSRIVLPSQNEPSSSQPAGTTPRGVSAPDVTNKDNPGPSIPRPSSTSKPHRPHESFALRNDGSSAMLSTPSINPTSTIPTSDSPLIRNDGSPQGASGSHQFGFLADGSRSGTTLSTHLGGDQGYNGPHGPTHPYSLYPQNTATVEELTNQHIPVGFPGHNVAYQRQLGPDGEEAGDLIGPLGHMEELPPYTRYPDQVYLRGGGFGASVTSGTETRPGTSSATGSRSDAANSDDVPSTTPTRPVPSGAGGIGRATRDPEYSSTDGSSVAVAGSSQSIQTDQSSISHDINIAARDFAEKMPMGKWRRRARKKLCGIIPYWAICLMVSGLVIVGIVMGAVVGTILTDDGGDDDDTSGGPGYPYGEVPTPADVEPLSNFPSNLHPLAVGLFDLPPLDVSQAPRSCFNDTTQSQAWNCDMPLRWYSMTVERIPNVSQVEDYEMTLTSVNGSDSMYLWGTQPPSIIEPVQLTLVNDTFEPSRGPAWWFKMNYNKVVIVAESSFTSLNQKRDWTYTGPPRPGFDPTRFMSKNPGPEDGDKPWFCTWPNTTMEVFIYPSQNSSVGHTSTSSTPPAGTTPTQSAAPQETSPAPYDPTPAYPQVVKFMERRLFMDGDEEAATCRQVKITNGGRDKEDVRDSDGNLVEVVVVERMSTYEELLEASQRSRHADRRWMESPLVKRESLELTDCGCLWWST